jgi:hypothetical protein
MAQTQECPEKDVVRHTQRERPIPLLIYTGRHKFYVILCCQIPREKVSFIGQDSQDYLDPPFAFSPSG